MSDIQKQAEFKIAGSPDWSVVTKDSVWVTTGRADQVAQMVEATNKVGFIVDVARPVPDSPMPSARSGRQAAKIMPSCASTPQPAKSSRRLPPIRPTPRAASRRGDGSIWIVTKPATLVRIDPATNAVVKSFPLPSESENPLFSGGFVWVSSYGHNQLLKVDPASGSIVATHLRWPQAALSHRRCRLHLDAQPGRRFGLSRRCRDRHTACDDPMRHRGRRRRDHLRRRLRVGHDVRLSADQDRPVNE